MNTPHFRRPSGGLMVAIAAGVAFVVEAVFAGQSSPVGLAGLLLANGIAAIDKEKLDQALLQVMDKIKGFATEANGRMEKGEKLTEGFKATIDEALVKMTTLQGQVADLHQKLAEPSLNGQRKAEKSTGELLVESADYVEWMKRGGSKARGSISVAMKAITSLGASAGDLVTADRQAGILALPQRQMTVRDLLAPGRTTSNLIEYVRQTGYTNNAATVPETTLKPQSDITFAKDNASVVTIAHWIKAAKQILDDAPQLQSFVDAQMRYGLDFREEAQLLRGSGAADNIHGIIPQATAYSAPIALADATTRIDVIRLAMLQVLLAEFPATGVVLHPSDWAAIELTKTSDGAYVFANPRQLSQPTVWGLPVVASQAMDLNEFLVGSFRLAAQVFDREDANVLISTEDQDNFVKNMVTIRAEERLGMVVYRPEAFVTGDFPA